MKDRRWLQAPYFLLPGCFLAFCNLQAVPIPGLFNTGVDNDGALLSFNQADLHYQLIQSADTNWLGPATRTLLVGFPVPPWLDEGPNSKWIAPRSQQAEGNASGNYIYRTTFDLTGLDPAKTKIVGKWASDNEGVDIRLNDVSLGFKNLFQSSDFSPFTITNGFKSGTNWLDFVVNNSGSGISPTGLRVEMEGVVEVPAEPPSIATQPENSVIIHGEQLALSVVSHGTPPLSYQWRFQGTNLSGARGATLTITAATLANAGAYSVFITNRFGVILSSNATVAVLDQIPGLFNSGVKDDFSPAEETSMDTHYRLIAGPGEAGGPVYIRKYSPLPGSWLTNSVESQWVSSVADGNSLPGDYVYRIAFSLGGFEARSAFIEGAWATDNLGGDIRLNGASTGLRNDALPGALTPFSITSGFQAGTNTLDFVVNNAGPETSPTGLRISRLRGGAQRTGPLTLQAALNAGEIRLSWPASSTSTVYVTDDLVVANWSKLAGPVTEQGGLKLMLAPVSGAKRFFRLQ